MDRSSPAREPNPLIITGMHRSGTSLLAGFFHSSGIWLGDQLLGARPSNPFGHFEDVEILEFHKGVLQREFGHTMWAPEPPRLTASDRAKAEALIADRTAVWRDWGWKEPRTCLFLDLWAELLPGARFLFVVRHPRLVLDSLGRRNKTRFYHSRIHNQFLRSWLVYNRECYRLSQESPARSAVVSLEGLVQSPGVAVARLSQWLGLSLDEGLLRQLYDARVLANRPAQLRLASPFLYRNCLAVYARLLRVARCDAPFAVPQPGANRRPAPSDSPSASGQGGPRHP